MNELISVWDETIQNARPFLWKLLWQSSVVILLIGFLDWSLARKVRAGMRYCLWMLVLIKLVLPPGLALPTSPAYWVRASQENAPVVAVANVISTSEASSSVPSDVVPLQLISEPNIPETNYSASLWVWLWLGGSLLLMVWSVRRYIVFKRGHDLGVPLPADLERLSEACRRVVGVRGVSVWLSDQMQMPCVVGLLNPSVILPRRLVSKMSDAQVEAVLIHEFVHIQRRDVWMDAAQEVLQAAYWWHPLVWWAIGRFVRFERKLLMKQ